MTTKDEETGSLSSLLKDPEILNRSDDAGCERIDFRPVRHAYFMSILVKFARAVVLLICGFFAGYLTAYKPEITDAQLEKALSKMSQPASHVVKLPTRKE